MQAVVAVPWWKRLLLAFTATLICLSAYSAVFAVLGYVRSHEPHESFFQQGGAAQGGAEVFFLGGFLALPCFFLIAAPLVLLVQVRLQLRRWYGFVLAAIVPFVLLQNFLGTPNLAILREKIRNIHWYQEVSAAVIPALPCALYLWLLRNRAMKPTDFNP